MIFMVLSSWQAIARVHSVYLMNADYVPVGCQPSDQANQLGIFLYESARKGSCHPHLPSPFIITQRDS